MDEEKKQMAKEIKASVALNAHRKYPFPKFTTRFNFKRNPLDEEYKQKVTVDWMKWWVDYLPVTQQRYWKHVANASLLFTTFFYCSTKSIQKYENQMQFMQLFFLTDEVFDINPSAKAEDVESKTTIYNQLMSIIKYLDGGPNDFSLVQFKPFSMGAFATGFSLVNDMNAVQRKRWLHYWDKWVTAAYEENLPDNPTNSLQELLKFRIDSVAGHLTILLMEYGLDIFINESDWNRPEMMKYIEEATKAIIFCNDMASFEKEMNECKGNINLCYLQNTIAFFVVTHKCSVYEAMEMTIDMFNESENEIQRIGEMMSNDKSFGNDVKPFVEGVKYVIGGHWIGSMMTSRYYNMTPSESVQG